MLSTTTSPGFWCECWTQNLDAPQAPALFGSYDAHDVVEANNWIATILRTISPALDTASCAEAWERLYDHRIDTRRALLRREPWSVSITHISTRITWTVRPVLFLPLAHRQGSELPMCAYDFKPLTP
ncbi:MULTISPECIES: hypothetical protein [Streptomyces]|uniref:Uncharacterized protein n=1 Tax=Streptomyces rochei TaxID=1928 RepID=A0AAX3ZUS0_STRRO|nr:MULTISPECIES: hypothetical protein [Streptomyces]RSS14171.1 hypothetical protein EF914_31420 [Streptomyces sp. WAC05458]RSS90795.1 hypothetical protein EF919_23855 [Streptomyces sp. WAC02707]WMC90550.1 hypothetical protein P7W03_35200 [Streptomyces rochei]